MDTGGGGGGPGGGGGGGSSSSGGSGYSFIPSKTWETNPGLAVQLWNAAIAASMAQAFQQDARYPLYWDVRDECVTTKALTGALVFERQYALVDQYGMDMPGGSVTEFNAVVAGTASSRNSTFRGNDWDEISAGNQAQYNFYQTFMATSNSGLGPVPIFVRDHGVDYGALAVEATREKIVVNGVDKSNIRRCDK